MQAKKPLTAKTPLKAKPKARRKPTPLNKKSAAQLIEPADKLFSRYIRLRDSEWVDGERIGECITCDRQLVVFTEGKFVASAQNGHLITRGCHQLRYNEQNCSLQCAHCNAWLDKDEMIERYRNAVDMKFGNGTYKRLKAASKREGAYKRLTKPELLEIIRYSTEQISFYLDRPLDK